MPAQADVDWWAALVARAYAQACRPPLSAAEEAQLAQTLNTPIADRVMFGEGLSAEKINPALARWEAMARRWPGPRLGRIDHGLGAVEMQG